MSSFTAQLHMVAQVDTDQWVNFLILVIMAILWLFGSLIKALSKKKSAQAQPGGLARGQRETWQQRLARKAEEIQRAAEAQRRQAENRMRRMEERANLREQAEQPPPGKLAVRSSRGGESILVYEQAESSADSTREQHAARQREAKQAVATAGRTATVTPVGTDLKPGVGEPADVMLHPPQSMEPGKEGLEAPREPTGYDPRSIIDYSDPDALKKAILHYEILGTPVGLRDPFAQSGTS